MNMDKLNSWMTLPSNIEVVAGLIFLFVEIQQSNDMIEFEARILQLSSGFGWRLSTLLTMLSVSHRNRGKCRSGQLLQIYHFIVIKCQCPGRVRTLEIERLITSSKMISSCEENRQ